MKFFWSMLLCLFFVGSVAQAQPPMPDPIGGGGGGANAPAECVWILAQLDQLNHVDIPAQEEVVRLAGEELERLTDIMNQALQDWINREGGDEETLHQAFLVAQAAVNQASDAYQLAMQELQLMQLFSLFLQLLFVECGCMTA